MLREWGWEYKWLRGTCVAVLMLATLRARAARSDPHMKGRLWRRLQNVN